MKYYLISSEADNSEYLLEKYKEIAQVEECVYSRHTPISYVSEPPDRWWYQDSAEKLTTAIEKREYEHKGVQWIKFKYPGKRYYVEDPDIAKMVELAGGQISIFARDMENSTRFFEERECETFFGSPDIGENMVLEFVDDGLEKKLLDFGLKNSNNN